VRHPRILQVTPDIDELPDIKTMQCPIADRYAKRIACMAEMDRNELAAHISEYHPDYHEDPEPYFDAERERRFK